MSTTSAWNTENPGWGVGSGDSSPSLKAAMESIAGILTAHGFAARAEEHDLEQSVVSDNCPFGAAAQHTRCCAPSTADSSRACSTVSGPNVAT